MDSPGTTTPTEEKTSQGDQLAKVAAKIPRLKVHIGDETFYCLPEPLREKSDFFANALAQNVSEVRLPASYVSSWAFCALYGWISKDNTPYATCLALADVPLAARYLRISSLGDFWIWQYDQQVRKIQERIAQGQQ